jgi:hypothetical protein
VILPVHATHYRADDGSLPRPTLRLARLAG